MSHWYDNKGNPQHFVIGITTGKSRPSTLADAKKNGWDPGVTGILQLINDPWLDKYKRDRLLEEVIANTWKPNLLTPEEKVNEWKGMITAQSKKHSEDAQDRGSEIHKALELYFKEGVIDKKESLFIEPVINYIHDTVPCGIFIPEMTFSCNGYGGSIDLIGETKQHYPVFLTDFKTKKNKAFDYPLKNDKYLMQIAAYVHAIEQKSGSKIKYCSNIFISGETPGLFKEECYTEEEIKRGIKMFMLIKDYWHLANNTGK